MEHKISNELPPIPSENMAPNLPQNPESQDAGYVTERQAVQAVESGAPAQSNPMQQQMAQAVPPPAAQPAPGQPVSNQLPAIADDNDLIEKEWVLKAKEIVARTRHDPYQQNKEVERIKADYMKKRYNKDVRVTED